MNISILLNEFSWIKKYQDYIVESLQSSNRIIEVFYNHDLMDGGDVCFILGYTEKVPDTALSKFTYNLVVHESDLPEGKGGSPLSWQILEGKTNIVFSLINAEKLIDSGDIWIKKNVKLNGMELCNEWREIQINKTVELCLEFLLNYNIIQPKKQKGESTYYPFRKKEDSELDINKTIDEQFNLLRIVDNDFYPAFFIKDGVKFIVKIYKV